VAGALLAAASVAQAEGSLPMPPFQMAATNHVIVGLAWDESVIGKMLPAGIQAVAGAPGAINIYTADRGVGIAPYQAVYFWVDVKGFDSPDGTKGRWMLAGAYGPNENTSTVLREVYGFPVRNGSARLERTADGKRATGMVGGKEVVVAEVKSSDECGPAGGLLLYPTVKQVVSEIPFAGDWCKAEPVSVNVVAPAGDVFSTLKPVKLLWAGEFRNGAFSFGWPTPMR
jgi:hypothetical protein